MRSVRLGLVVLTLSVMLAPAPPAHAAKGPKPNPQAGAQLDEARKDFGLEALKDWNKISSFLWVILGAAGLGVVLAFHPFAGKKGTLEDLEQPKIIITYTVVGALIAIVVAAIPNMGFAIFGIGGLMRFRTELGAAKETGRVILATILGLVCGLQFWMVAILGTAIAWILIWILEARVGQALTVRGLKSETISQSADAYGAVLRKLKCSFSSPRKNPGKGQLSFALRAPRGLDREEVEIRCEEEVPKDLRGTLDWPQD
jgi:hypothetical protein